jgi:hypothetical protein
MVESKLKDLINSKKTTFLGAGPMSKTFIDVVIEAAQELDQLIALIPSRRQIECAELGGGYVEKWSTETFAAYVKSRDLKQNVVLSRDHCGPWQISSEIKGSATNLDQEMSEVLKSLEADIRSGFQIIHVDPSLGYRFGLKSADIHQIAFKMIEFCEEIKTSNLIYEIGTEEQNFLSGKSLTAELELQQVLDGLKQRGLPKPSFFVQQTGTKVQELRNVGNFDREIDAKGVLPVSVQVPMTLRICEEAGLWLKEHNADYLSNQALDWHKRFGIHAANVAPEFGVAETRALLDLTKEVGAKSLGEEFHTEVLQRRRWEKWLTTSSAASPSDKVLIAGHYHFSEKWCLAWREKLFTKCDSSGIDAQSYLEQELKKSLYRYLRPFGYTQ